MFLLLARRLPLSFLVGGRERAVVGVDRSLVITTWGAAAGWLRLVSPTNAILVAGLALAKVSFDQYVRFVAPLMGLLLVVILAVLMAGVARV